MADIGPTLRETRIRKKIDIGTVEEATKIRAKYLRALENEEWQVLPGPTYAKSFLRTYAEYLGVDAHLLVEEYRARFEPPEELELPAFAGKEPLRSRVRPLGPPSRGALIAVLVAGFVALLLVLGLTAGDNGNKGRGALKSKGSTQGRSASGASGRKGGAPAGSEPRGRRRKVGLVVVAARDVWVCLLDSKGKLLIKNRIIPAGGRKGPFKSRRFKITLGNGGGDLLVNRRLRDVPERPAPASYSITPAGLRPLKGRERPTCAPGEGP